MYYLHINEDNQSFGFFVEGIHEIDKDKDIPISDEDYDTFFKNQSNGTQYRLKETRPSDNSGGLFDYVEVYTPKQDESITEEPTLEDRIASLEQAFIDMM